MRLVLTLLLALAALGVRAQDVINPGTGSGGTPGGANTQVQFNNAGSFGGSANLTWISPALSIGAAGATGQLKLLGTTSGTAIITPQATAGTPTITLPNASGTACVSATTPIALDSTTGALSWTGATLTGTPAAGDLSYWTGATTEALVLNSSGAAGRPLVWASGAAPTWSTGPLLLGDGTPAAPSYAFASASGTGMYASAGGTGIRLAIGGGLQVLFGTGTTSFASGSSTGPSITDLNNGSTGFYWPANNTIALANGTDGEWVRWGSFFEQLSRGSADATAFAINARKSRGTVASPTVITTGDDLLTINAAGYLGGTNTYVNAGRIKLKSIGTISDATTGIGGEVVLATSKQGVDTSPADSYKLDQFGHFVSLVRTANTPTMGACGTSPSIIGTDETFTVTVGTGGAATACVINFGTAYVTNPPNCSVLNNTDKVAYSTVEAVGSLTINAAAAFTASSKFKVTCKGFL